MAANLTMQQCLLVFGDLSRTEEWERMKALWESHPHNPAYFARYAQSFISKTKSLPPGFLKIAGEIDPDKAWFTYIAAGITAKVSVKRREQTKAGKLAHKAFEWDITNQTRFDQGIAILRQARKQPRCDSYWGELLNQQLSLISGSTPPEVVFAFFYPYRSSSAEVVLRDLAYVFCAKAWLAGETEDTEGFFQALADADDFVEKRTNAKVESLLSELLNTVGAAGVISNLSAAADILDLHEESEKLTKIHLSDTADLAARILAATALLYFSAAPVFKWSANRWFGRDQLHKASRDDPHWTVFERKNALQLRKELRDWLGFED